MLSNSNQSADNAPASAVVIRGLNYQYPGQDTPALTDISLDIPRGSCFGLLGPNGAGKTTLISLLTGVLDSQQGDISSAGHSAAHSRVALVPQEYAFYPALTGRENLEFFCGLYRIPRSERKQRIDECASLCALEAVLDQRSGRYSGGIKRRLNIAIALLGQPSVLYLDEPTVGIDAQSRNFILRGIAQLKASGMTIVYTSHYMEEVEQLCDQVAIIDHGKVVLQQSMDSLLSGGGCLAVTPKDKPSDSVVDACLQAGNLEWDGEQFRVEIDKHTPAAAITLLEANGIAVGEIHMGRHRLETVYLTVTEHALRD